MLDGELRSTTSGSPLSTALVVSARLVVAAKCVASNESVTLSEETSCGRALEPQVSRRMNEATQSTLQSFADGAQVGVSAS